MRQIKKRVLVLLSVWVLLLAAVLAFLAHLDASLSYLDNTHTITSIGWAGYIISSIFNEQRDIVAISASWIVPKINASAGNGQSSAWIGIGGQLDKTLIQAGTEHNLRDGVEQYAAWYELLPAYAIRIESMVISPGHLITAAIRLVDTESATWNIQLHDVSNGQGFNQNFVYNSTLSSGEWIVERSFINGQISSLADFGSVTFSACKVEVGSENGAISSYTYSIVHMTNQQFGTLATTQPLNRDGTEFSVNYLMSN